MPLFQMPPSDVDLTDPSEVAKLIERVFSTPLELKRTSMKIKAKNPDPRSVCPACGGSGRIEGKP